MCIYIHLMPDLFLIVIDILKGLENACIILFVCILFIISIVYLINIVYIFLRRVGGTGVRAHPYSVD